MKHVVIVGGGAALAQPVIRHFLDRGDRVTAVCRLDGNKPTFKHDQLETVGPSGLVEGAPDVLVTLAGRVSNARLGGMSTEAWQTVIDDNLTVVAMALNLYLPSMLMRGGNVVVVGSVVGSTGGIGCANYAAAKAGLVGLVRAAANETAARGVCVNLLQLGYIDAGMGARLDPKVKERVKATIPLGRFGSEEDVVAAVDYLARVRYMTGNVLTLAGGLR